MSEYTFTIEEDNNGMVPPADDLVIEDLPEEHDHDDLVIEDLPEDYDPEDPFGPHHSLPSVEEAHANLPNQKAGHSKKLYLIIWAVLAVAALLLSAIAIGAKNNNKEAVYEPNGRTKRVMDFIFENQVSTLPDLDDVYSAQHRAAAFVADGDAYQIELSEENAAKFVERYVLSLLYYQFKGPGWTYNLKFLSDRDHCEWWDTFETASGETLRQGVICNEDGYVVELNLAWNGLKGTHISREIGYLGQLETLHMYYNDIGGYFPDSFRHMPNLKGIGLMKTGLIGTLPDWIGEMTQLTTLGLGDNQIHGEVPESIKNLKNIKILSLDGNNGLTGSFNKFKSLNSLEALYLENNALTGSLDNFNWPKLIELDVSDNMLDGSIPASLFNHPTLQVVDIHKNMFIGSFPDDIFENNNLQYLAMHQNLISSTIPDRLAFLNNLKHLDLSFNGLTGTIPDTLTQLTELRYLASSGNRFDAQGLLDMSQMTNLMDLAMKGNNLNGKIPDWIGGMTNLQLLDLDANELTGTIPSWIGLLRDLDHLLLNRNKLTGTIPTQMENMYHLNVILLDGNSLKGNADAICESDKVNPSFFVSDCYPGENGERPEIECRCCTQCCTDDDPSCNDKQWTSNVDPVWEYGYVRPKYTFSLENAPSMYSKYGDGENYDNPLP